METVNWTRVGQYVGCALAVAAASTNWAFAAAALNCIILSMTTP